jgi:hypothetical protein
MATPKGMRQFDLALDAGMKVQLYSSPESPCIIVQLRAAVPTETDVLAPSFKIAAALTPREARMMARELFRFVDMQPERIRLLRCGCAARL